MGTTEDLELLPCTFQFHDFHDQLNEVKLHCQVIKMDQSLFLWVGNRNDGNMKDLALAFVMENQARKPVVASKILGAIAEETSINLASRLSKKLGKPVYISFNIDVNNQTLPIIERRIFEEFKKHPDLLDL